MASLNLPSSDPSPLPLATVSEPNPNQQTPSYEPPMGVPLPLVPTSTPRRLPPPCWTPDETSVLIDAYRDKWYSLRRGNLRAAHWEDVASHIHSLCPHVLPPKTSVQCRHKMEKLRKRYRAELHRAKSIPHHRFSSSWVYFSKMDSMEKNSDFLQLPSPQPLASEFVVVDVDVDDDVDYALKSGYNNTYAGPSGMRFVNVSSDSCSKKRKMDNGVGKKVKGDEAGLEMVEAIRMLGDGFVKMEKMKMDMMRETERLRMEMEMKRTQMLLDSQHRIVQAFAKGWTDLFTDGKNDQDAP